MKLYLNPSGRIDLICPHGVAHPSERLTRAAGARWKKPSHPPEECCGCCESKHFKRREQELAGEVGRDA